MDVLIDAFVSIARERPDWSLAILGDGVLRASLSARVPDDLGHRIRWFGFLNDQAELSRLYRAMDVLVLTSSYEPWALVLNEAAAAGLAIVATNVVGAASELVRDGVNGRVVPPGQREALAAAMLDVTDPANTARMRAESPRVLSDWRDRADSVQGVRAALRSAGVLPTESPPPGPYWPRKK